ncbi:MAG: PIN domain-containing protein [Verrucomicrobia bacterium]|nr:PIN domain-containing protein [Verrucomicrobiota bacterium]MBV8485085.1 PIN domain-containing protein [Verrucomicrobiota bacterium]
MISLDANLLLYAYNEDSPHHEAAFQFLGQLAQSDDVAMSEFVLTELYTLLRNPAVVAAPLSPADAVRVVEHYRRHSRWALLGFAPESVGLHTELWSLARRADFSRRRIYDARTALTLRRQGVTDFATANVKDFKGFGFRRVWNPLAE